MKGADREIGVPRQAEQARMHKAIRGYI